MKKWEQLIAKLDNKQSDMVIGLIKENIKGQMEEQTAEKKIDESNTGEKNGGQSNADMSQKVQTPEKPLLKEMADSTTKGSCFEPHYEPCKHPGCPYRKPPMGVGYEASERMKTKHVRHLKKRKLFNDSNDGSVEDNVGTGTLIESEMELPKKVSGGNADKHFSGGNANKHFSGGNVDKHSEGELPRSTPAKKDSGGNAELDDAMQCWSSLLPKSTQGQYYVTVAGKRMLIIVKERQEENRVSETDDETKKKGNGLVIPESDFEGKGDIDGQLDSENNSTSTQSMIDLPKVSSGEGYSVSDTEAYSDGKDQSKTEAYSDGKDQSTTGENGNGKHVIPYEQFIAEIKEEQASDTEESSGENNQINIIIEGLELEGEGESKAEENDRNSQEEDNGEENEGNSQEEEEDRKSKESDDEKQKENGEQESESNAKEEVDSEESGSSKSSKVEVQK